MTNKQAWKKLLEVYRPNPTPSAAMYEEFIRVTVKYSEIVMDDTVEHVIAYEKWFPSIALFRDYASEFQAQIDEEAHKKRKKQENQGLIRETGLGKQVMTIVRRLMKGEFTRREYIEELKKLGIDPGLESWYAQNGYDLDGKARVSKMGSKIL